MRGLLSLPGTATWAGASPEGLDFLIQHPAFDIRPAEARSRHWGLQPRPLAQALAATARFVLRESDRLVLESA